MKTPTSSISPLVVVSPHYDDAVFSCGDLLAVTPHSTVVTVYTGLPSNADTLTDWDQRCGFSNAEKAIRARADENRRALALLHARGVNLEFLDSQYARECDNGPYLLSDALSATIAQIQPAAVFFPLGLFHEDHISVSDVLLTICHHFPDVHWFVYEEIPYRKQARRAMRRLARFAQCGVVATPFRIEGAAGYKNAAIRAYQSQLRGLGCEDGQPILRLPEQYWQIQCKMALL